MIRTLSRRSFLSGLLAACGSLLIARTARADLINFNFLKKKGAVFPFQLPEEKWRARLGKDYAILREGENETAGSSPLVRERRRGIFACRGCGQALFSSTAKTMTNDFPTFRSPLGSATLGSSADFGIILPRTEIHCRNCGSHLGYKFTVDDNAGETWRYVMNGASLAFRPQGRTAE